MNVSPPIRLCQASLYRTLVLALFLATGIAAVSAVPLKTALDLQGEVEGYGWTGIVDTKLSYDKIDVARSTSPSSSNSNWLSCRVIGPAEVKFLWKKTGEGWLSFDVGGLNSKTVTQKGKWIAMTVMVDEGSQVLNWKHTPGYPTTGEAFVDQLSVRQMPARTLSSVTCGNRELPLASLPVTGNIWSPHYYLEEEVWKDCAQALGGGSPMKLSVKGPVILNFKVKCMDPSAPTTGSGSSSGSSMTVIDENTRTYKGSFLSVKVNGVEVTRTPGVTDVKWVPVSIVLPEGQNEVSWDLISQYNYYYEPRQRFIPAERFKWVWLDDLVLKSTDTKYGNWASGKKLAVGKDLAGEDADGDGVSNFFEYAFATDPLKGTSAPPKFSARMVKASVQALGGGSPSDLYVVSVPFLPTKFTGHIEESADMVNWTVSSCQWKTKSAASALPSPGSKNLSAHQEFEIPVDRNRGGKFYRLKLTGGPP